MAAALADMSAAEIEKYAPALVKRAEAEADRAFQTQKMKDTQAFEGRQNALDRSSRERQSHEGVQANRLEGDVQKLGKDTESLGTIANDVALLEGYANKPAGTDIPGAGMVDSLRPDWVQSDEGLKVQQAALRVAAELLHQQSGAAVSPSEAARFMGGRGLGAGATESAWRQGVQALAGELRQSLASKQAKYRPEVVQTLQQRGGLPSLGGGASVVEERVAPDGRRLQKMSDGSVRVANGG